MAERQSGSRRAWVMVLGSMGEEAWTWRLSFWMGLIMLFLDRVMIPPPFGLTMVWGGGAESCGDDCEVGGGD